MKYDIIIAGVGGQGILSIATVLGRAALKSGLHLKQPEVHGMAQRGGAVFSHFRLSDGKVYSDVIPHGKADLVVAMEPMEALRYMSWLAPGGWLISNEKPLENIPDYPDLELVYAEIRKRERHLLFDGSGMARDKGSPRALNMALLGAASPFIPITQDLLEEAIAQQFVAKGNEVIDTNILVFRSSRELAEEHKTLFDKKKI